MSFKTVLSIVGVAFSAFELYKRFHPKVSSGSAQRTISPREEPKQSVAGTSEAPTRVEPTNETPRSAAELCSGFASSSKIGMA